MPVVGTVQLAATAEGVDATAGERSSGGLGGPGVCVVERDGGFRRVLFLFDRNNLGDQTLREFQNSATPGDGRRFTELYNVDKSSGSPRPR